MRLNLDSFRSWQFAIGLVHFQHKKGNRGRVIIDGYYNIAILRFERATAAIIFES